MLKCDLNHEKLVEVKLLFGSINKSRLEITAGMAAQEEYAATVNEINGLNSEDSEYGEVLCQQALKYLSQIQAAESAQLNIVSCQEELGNKYGIPAPRLWLE